MRGKEEWARLFMNKERMSQLSILIGNMTVKSKQIEYYYK